MIDNEQQLDEARAIAAAAAAEALRARAAAAEAIALARAARVAETELQAEPSNQFPADSLSWLWRNAAERVAAAQKAELAAVEYADKAEKTARAAIAEAKEILRLQLYWAKTQTAVPLAREGVREARRAVRDAAKDWRKMQSAELYAVAQARNIRENPPGGTEGQTRILIAQAEEREARARLVKLECELAHEIADEKLNEALAALAQALAGAVVRRSYMQGKVAAARERVAQALAALHTARELAEDAAQAWLAEDLGRRMAQVTEC